MIYLITPTGSRPAQIRHCADWMRNQTYKGEVTWIIIDDCLPLTTDFITEDFREKWKIIKRYPKPAWQNGMNTQARNISDGINLISHYVTEDDIIFIIEDDDYYKPVYLERMIERMGEFKIIGETNTIYYNVITRRFADNCNKQHASLFQIAFKPSMIPLFVQSFKAKFIDCTFFSVINESLVNLFHDGTLAVGIKGLPGRGGIGAGHSSGFMANNDTNLRFLKNLIGEDAEKYRDYYNDKIVTKTIHVNANRQRRINRNGTLFKSRMY
jgi:glycosyltransferase involved in cell wall biosynthesis